MANRKYANAVQERKARTRLNNKYKKTHQTAFTFRYHNINDKDIIEKLNNVPNKIDYVRRLIRADLDEHIID